MSVLDASETKSARSRSRFHRILHILNLREDVDLIFLEMIRNLIRTSVLDISFFIFLTICASFIVYGFSLVYISKLTILFYFMALVSGYLYYMYKIRPYILGKKNDKWTYYSESNRDPPEKKSIQLKTRIEFLKTADKYVHMRMGELNSIIWNKKEILDSLKELVAKGVDIEIIIKTKIDVKDWELIKLALEGKIRIYMVDENLLNSIYDGHFMITEKGNAWIVRDHLPFDTEKKGGYIFNPTIVSQMREEDFILLRNKGVLLDKESIKHTALITRDEGGKGRTANDQERQELFQFIGI